MYVHLAKEVRGSIVFLVLFFCMLLSAPFGTLPVVHAQETPLKEMELLGSRIRHRITSFRFDRVKKETEYDLKILNLGRDPIYPPIRMVIESISAAGVTLANPDGQMDGKDYVELGPELFENGVFLHAQAIEHVLVQFANPSSAKFSFDVSFHGQMALEGTSFAAVGVHQSAAIDSLTLQTLSARLDRSRGGMEYLVRLRNTGDETVYGPIKLIIDSVSPPEASLGDAYGEIGGKPFVYVESQLPDGKLEPAEQSDSFWLFFDNPTQVKFIYSTISDGHAPYFLDIGDQVDVQVNEVLTELGVSTYSLQITNLSVQDITGPVRVRVNSATVNGIPVGAGNLSGFMQSKSGQTAAGQPFQALLANGVTLAQDGIHTADMVWGNASGGTMTFDLSIEELYQGLTPLAALSVVVESESHDSGNGTTAQVIKVTNTGTDTVVAPLVVVVETISDNDASVDTPNGFINGKAFFEIPLVNGILGPSQSSPTITINYADAGQAPFTATFTAQASTLAFVDTEAPVTTHDYLNDGIWGKEDVTVNFSATDNFSGVKETRLKVNSDPEQIGNQLTFTSSGEYLVEYYSVDNAGNAETPRQLLVRIDKIIPVTTDNFIANGQWVKDDISITLTPTDGNSGIQDTFFKIDAQAAQTGTTVSITAAGEHTVEYWSVDFAGNVGDSTFLVAKLDKSPPQTQDDYDGEPILATITIGLSATDDLSGVAVTKYKINTGSVVQGTSIFIAVAGDYTILYWSEDIAGNIEDAHQLDITVEAASAPVVFISSPANGLTTAENTIDIFGEIDDPDATIELNGVFGTIVGDQFEILNVPLTEGEIFYNIVAKNTAGLERSVFLRIVKDTTPPQVVITTPENDGLIADTLITITGEVLEAESSVFIISGTGTDTPVTVDNDNTFTLVDVPLVEGVNEIRLYGVDALGNSGKTQGNITLFTITSDQTPPGMTVEMAVYDDNDTAGPFVPLTFIDGEISRNVRVAKVDIRGQVDDLETFVEVVNPLGGSTLVKAVKINGANVPIDNEGRFSKSGISFVLAENQTAVVSVSAADLIKNINILDITLRKDTTGPEIFLTSFASGALTNDPTPITVAGVARGTTAVVVNGVSVPVANERFERTGVVLLEGDNSIVVSGLDPIGNQTVLNLIYTLDTTAPAAIGVTSPISGLNTNTDRVTIVGTGEPNASVLISGGALDVEANISSTGVFTQNVFLLVNAVNSIKLIHNDIAGNLGPEVIVEVIQDQIKPTLTVLSPASGVTPSSQVLVSGSANDNRTLSANADVSVKNSQGTVIIQKTVALSNKQFSTVVDVENEGSYTVIMTVSDKAGNTQTKNVAIQHILPSVDNDGPNVVVLEPQDGSFVNNPAIVVSGTAIDPNAVNTLQISVNEEAFSNVTSFNAGTGEFSHSLTLDNDGVHTIKIKAVDGTTNNNETIITLSLTLDTVPPVLPPVVSGVTPAIEIENEGFLTSVDSIRVIGAYEPGFTVSIQSPVETKEGIVNAGGLFDIAIKISKSSVQNVENILTLIGSDLAGNQSGSSTVTITYDAIKPAVNSIIPVNGETAVPVDTVIIVEFTESIQLGSLSDNQGNRIYVTDSLGTRYDGTLTPVEASNDTVSIQLAFSFLDNEGNQVVTLLPDSETLTVTVAVGIKDVAGNALANTFTSQFFTIDETAPETPVITEILPGLITNLSSVTVVGTCEANIDIQAFVDDVLAATEAADANGDFSVSVPLNLNAENIITLKGVDSSLNESELTDPETVLHDNVQPKILVLEPDNGAQNILKNSVFVFKFDEALDQASVTQGFAITDKNGTAIAGTLALIANDNDTLKAGIRFTPSAQLIDGDIITITLSNDLTDRAANSPDYSLTGNVFTYFVIDTVAPEAPVIDTVSEQSPTTASSVIITGTVEPGAIVNVVGGDFGTSQEFLSDNDTGAFSVTVPLQTDKNNTIQLTAEDASGNVSPNITISIFSDQKAPTLTSFIPGVGQQLSIGGLITLIFNEAVDQATLASSVLLKKGAVIVPITINVNEAGSIVTLSAQNNLEEQLSYTLFILETLTDEAGNAFTPEKQITYFVNDTVIPEKPAILQLSQPAITQATEVIATVSGNYDTTITKLQARKGNTVVAEVTPDESTITLITIPLELNKLNKFDIIAARPSGNKSLPEPFSITQDSTAPEIVILSPPDGVTLPSDTVTLVVSIKDASPISSALVNGEQKILNIDSNGLLNTVLTEIPDGFAVEIIITDIAGNTSTISTNLSVSPEDPETETSAPIIAIISPEDGIDLDGSSIDVLGTVIDANEISMITINDEVVDTPTSFPTAGSLFDRRINNLVDGVNLITVKAWDTKNNMGEESISINVDVAPPSLVILSPDNEAVFLSSDVTVSGVVTDSNGIASFTLNDEEVSLENDGSFSKLLILDAGENTIVFRATDLASNVVTKTWVLYYDVEGPEVSLMYPADGSTGIPSDTAIYVNFNERVNAVTVSLNTVKVIELDDIGDEVKELTGNVVLEGGKMASFYPGIGLLTPGVSYRIKVLDGIQDLVGFELQSPQESTFTISEQVTTIYGLVADLPTGKGIANVKVEIVGEDITTTTDENGNYELSSPRIPGGNVVFHYDAANGVLAGEVAEFQNTVVPIFIETNKITNLNSYTFLPRVLEESTQFITGVDDQIITFNDTITGYTEELPDEPPPTRFSLTVPAGALEFPNGATSGQLSGLFATEQWLPVSTIENSGAQIPIISAVWFHPFGVQSSVPLEISLPIPVDRGETGAVPGDRYFVVSYNSQTAEWEQVGVARVNDDASMFVLDPENDSNGLTELTIAGIVPYAITPAVEEELSALRPYIRPGTNAGGENETEFFLIELMVALTIFAMMSPWSIHFWRTTFGPEDTPLASVDVDFIGKHDISGLNGLVSDHHFFPIWPNLLVLMVFMNIEWATLPETQWSYTTTRFGGGVRKFPILGLTQYHSVFSGNWINWRNAPKIRFDSWSFHGNIRFIDGNGNPTTNPGIAQNPRMYIFSPDAGSLWGIGAGSLPADKYPVESSYASEAPFNPDPNQKFYKSYDFVLLAALFYGNFNFHRNTVEYEDPSGGGASEYQLFRSHIIPGGNIRIMSVLKGAGGEVHVGEVWRKAPFPVVVGGDVGGMDIFGDLSIGKLNIDVFLSYTKRFDTPGQTPSITQGTVPDKGLVSHTSDRIQIVNSTGIHNGNKAPEGPWTLKMQVTSPAGNDIVTIGPNTAESWLRNAPLSTGKYSVKVSSSDDFGGDDLLSINLSANDTQSSAGSSSSAPTSTPPPISRPTRGRSSATAGRYVQPRSETRSAARVTPAPPSNTDRKEYVWYVLPTLLFNIPTDASNIVVTFNNWAAFAASAGVGTAADLSTKPGDETRNIMDGTTGNKPLIYMNPSEQVTVKVEFKIQSYTVDDATAGPVFRILQTGAPALIGRPLKDNFANLLKQNATQTPSPQHQVYIQDATAINVEAGGGQSIIGYPNYASPAAVLVDLKNTGGGSTITVKTVPSATNVAADAIEISQYRNFIDTNLRSVLTRRKWQVEILDRRTMIKNDTDEITQDTAGDAIVNVLETIVIEAR